MLQVNRNNLKIPKRIKVVTKLANNIDDSIANKEKREHYQKGAIVKLKLLGYIAMVSESSDCILAKQYKQISIQLSETINLIVAWKKSDDERWKKEFRILG